MQQIEDILFENASKNSTKLAVRTPDAEFTFGELAAKATVVAHNLASLGLRQGDRVALLMGNCIEFIISFFALARLGCVIVPIGTRNRESEINYILAHSEARAIISITKEEDFNFIKTIQKLQTELPELQRVICLEHENPAGTLSFDSLLKVPQSLPIPDSDQASSQNQGFMILYTSGTMGKSKGVLLRQDIVIDLLKALNQRIGAAEEDIYLVCTPVTSSLGVITSMLRAFFSGSSVVLAPRFKAAEILAMIEKFKVTIHPAVPTMLALELMALEKNSYELSSLKYVILSGSEVDPDLVKRIETRMGCKVIVGYGLTETVSYITTSLPDDQRSKLGKYVGAPVDGVQIKVIGPEGETLKPGEVGEIAVRGNCLMDGYYHEPELTAQIIDDGGWLHTGDLGAIDFQGGLEFWGRKKDIIIRGGFNIYPFEIENLLGNLENVEMVSVIGIADPVLGERVVACIIPVAGSQIDSNEIRQFCKKFLADYKVPEYVFLFREFPMTANGKVKKIELQKLVQDLVK